MFSIKSKWRLSIFEEWVSRRNPPSDTKRLNHRNIFILPTKEGVLFGVLLLILLLTAINYQNSLVYLFTFLLGALFFFSINFCFNNMSGLSLGLVGTTECFEGESAGFSLVLKSDTNQNYESLVIGVLDELSQRADVPAHGITDVLLYKTAVKRGGMRLGRVKLETRFPLGLIKAWTFFELKTPVLVFPKPEKGSRTADSHAKGEPESSGVVVKGQDELAGLRDYTAGDSMSRIAWKHYASKGELYVKELDALSASTCWLNYDDYPVDTKEQRLRHLCHDVLASTEKDLNFGLILPKNVIEPSQGEDHKLACLRALAVA